MANKCASGYSGVSILIHWITAIAVIALFLTHEGERGSPSYAFHVGGGAIIGLLLIWRVVRRTARGWADKPEQNPVFNLLASIVGWGLLLSILIVTVSGYLLPWSLGAPLDIYGTQIPSPISANENFHEFMEEVHEISGHLLVPLFGLHVLGTLKHVVSGRRDVLWRIFKPTRHGH